MSSINHPHVKRIFPSVDLERDGTIKQTMVIETDIELDGTAPGYNEADFNDLVDKIARPLLSNSTIDRVTIRNPR
ncbi:MAG: hypothetical protein HZC25_08610 [Rhodospirillales bacterium]|nr:hypothetical protein [Rhodospirillales bacterium]